MTETQPQVIYKPHCRNGAFILMLCTDPITEMGVTHTVGHKFYISTYYMGAAYNSRELQRTYKRL